MSGDDKYVGEGGMGSEPNRSEMCVSGSGWMDGWMDGGEAIELKVETRGQAANSLPESRGGSSFDCLVNRNKTPVVLAILEQRERRKRTIINGYSAI